MDTSKEYIKMCEKAVKIQELRKEIDSPDSILFERNQNAKAYLKRADFYSFEGSIFTASSYMNVYTEVWLPRQDQLQGMVKEKNPNDLLHQFFTEIYEWQDERYDYPKDYYMQFTFMEQLWLAFVMKEKYNKIWNGKDWK